MYKQTMGKRIGYMALALLLVLMVLVIPTNKVQAAEAAYDVGLYKGEEAQENWTYPEAPEGKVFAGWYTDESYTVPYTETTGQAYAKFVPAELMGVKKQLSTGASLTSDTINIRFVTAIDSLNLKSVSFLVSTSAGKSWVMTETTAYSSILADGQVLPITPQAAFGEGAKYFVLHSLTGIPKAAYNDTFQAVVSWNTLDGTKVTAAQPNTFTVKEEIVASCAHTNNVEYVEAVAPGCENEGNIEYWHCTACGAAWEDEARTKAIDLKNVQIAPSCSYSAAHNEGVAAGCHYTGMSEYWYCANCDVYYADAACTVVTNYKNLTIPALQTTAEHVDAKTPTCTENGNVEYWVCYECEQVWTDEALTQLSNIKNVILPSAHNYVNGKCASCGATDPDYVAPPVAPTESTDSRWIYKNVLTETGWTNAFNSDSGSYDEEKNYTNLSDGVLEITDDATTRVSAIKGLKELTGKVVVEFEVSSTALSETSGLFFDIRGKNADGAEKQAVDVRMFSDGINCYTTQDNKVSGTYKADTTYKVQIAANVTENTYSVFIDGTLTHKNMAMRNTVVNLSKLRLWTTSDGLAATVTYENLKIYYLNCPHTNEEQRNVQEATCGAAGYTGDTHCADCGIFLRAGESTEATGAHSYNGATCSVCGEPNPDYVAPPVAPTDDNDSRWIYQNVLTDGGTWTPVNTDGTDANSLKHADGKLQITDDANTIVTAKRGVRELQGEVVVEFEVSSTAMSDNSGLYFALFNGSIGADVRMFANGIQCYYFDENGKLDNSKVAGTYTADTTYKVQIVVNTEDGTFDVFVDEALIFENLRMRNNVKTIKEIRFYTTSADLAATVTYENLKIYYLNEQTAE